MKKFLTFMVIAVVVFSSLCFALEDDSLYDYNIEEPVDDAQYLDNYDDFYSAYNSDYTQNELREYYREYLSYSREQNAMNTQNKSYKAKVVDVGKEETAYGMDYYTPYKIHYQTIKIEVLEGEYKGKIFDVKYILTADTYENMQNSKANLGDTLYVTLSADDNGTMQAYTSSYDTRMYKSPKIITMAVIALLLVIIFGKLKGFKVVLLTLLIFDLVFLVTMPSLLKNNEVVVIESSDSRFPSLDEIDADETIGVLEVDDEGLPTKVEVVKKSAMPYVLMVIDIVIISAVCLINNLGLSRKTLYAFGISVCTLLLIFILTVGINLMAGMNGNTFEAVSISENIINKNINYNSLYVLLTLIVGSILIPNAVSKAIQCRENENYKEIMSEYLSSQIGIMIVFLVAILIPKIMGLVEFNYSTVELLNSEMLSLEIMRVVVLVIGLVFSVKVTEVIMKKLNNKIEN